jgi:hypothetical protein
MRRRKIADHRVLTRDGVRLLGSNAHIPWRHEVSMVYAIGAGVLFVGGFIVFGYWYDHRR